MNSHIHSSVCPHDCPSACALQLEVDNTGVLQKVKGNPDQEYTIGTICSKVARYRDRLYHPDRLTYPLKRTGEKGSGEFERISWEQALDEITERFQKSIQQYGPETVWPYHYAGTMGVLQRGILNAFRHGGGYSGQDGTICVRIGGTGWKVGTGSSLGVDPREIDNTHLLVLWGTNATATQINVMTHYRRAKSNNGAKLVVIDPYFNETAKSADVHLAIKPGTDGALACAVMHVLLKENLANRDYLESHTDFDSELEKHFATKTPEWAAKITGLKVQQIRDFALMYGQAPSAYIRLGIGLSRQRNGAVSVHAISCLPSILGNWDKPGSGGMLSVSDLFQLDDSVIQGKENSVEGTRILDMCQIGAVLTGDKEALRGGPPITAMLVQNTNPAVVAPNLNLVHQGLQREDLFLCVHEHFLTDTARYADIVLPATMFCEHDDIYKSYGHTFLQAGPKITEPIGECWSNYELLKVLADRLDIEMQAFQFGAQELLDQTLLASGHGSFSELVNEKFVDLAANKSSNLMGDGFAWPDGKFRFKPDWQSAGPYFQGMPTRPDHWDVQESSDENYPFRLITPTAKGFLNSTFNNIALSRRRAVKPTLMMNPDDALSLELQDDSVVRVRSRVGGLLLHLEISRRVPAGSVVSEGLWSGTDHIEGLGINVLVDDQPAAPAGGAVFHDTAVSVSAI